MRQPRLPKMMCAILMCFISVIWSSRQQSVSSAVAQSASGTAKAAAGEMKPYVEIIPGSDVQFEMAAIPGGTFTMGSPASEPNRAPDEGPPHEVVVRPFWMSMTEVTWDEYDVFAFAQGVKKDRPQASSEGKQRIDAVTRPTPPYGDETSGFGRHRFPVINITHHAAMEYCRWLSAKTGKIYRLPTEAEWEYAARAGSRAAYSFGDGSAKLGEHAWHFDNSEGQTRPVAKKKPNAWGLYDMHGNVAEWVLDHYDAAFYNSFKPGSAPAPSPVLLPTEKRFPHVARGGSWDDDAPRLRSAARRASSKEWIRRDPQTPQSIWWLTDAAFVGFRIVRPLEEQDNLKGLKSKVTKASP